MNFNGSVDFALVFIFKSVTFEYAPVSMKEQKQRKDTGW